MTLVKQVAEVRVSNVDKKSIVGESPVRLCNYTDVYYGDMLRASGREFMAATASQEQRRNFTLHAGDVVLTKDSETADDIGVSAFIDESAPDLVCGYHLAILRPQPALVDPKFLFWVTRSVGFTRQLAVAATGVTRFGLRAEAIKNANLHLPWLPDQRRIADFLDDQVGRLDRLMKLRLRQKDLVEERFEDLRETMIEDSDVRRPLREMTSTSRPINYGVLMPGPSVSGGIPLIEAGDCMRGDIVVDNLRRTEPAIEREFTRSRLAEGDCVMAIRGSIGAVRSVPRLLETVNVTRDAARIVPQPEVVSTEYLRHALSTRRAQEWLKLRAGGAAVKGINIADLRKLPVALPTLSEQKQVEARLAFEENACRLLTLQLMDARNLVNERKQTLITAAITGQLDVTTARPIGVA